MDDCFYEIPVPVVQGKVGISFQTLPKGFAAFTAATRVRIPWALPVNTLQDAGNVTAGGAQAAESPFSPCL